MRTLPLLAVWAALAVSSLPAWACGGGFGTSIRIDPAQTIVVAHRNGQEDYVFQPRFCGKASEFGLLLPVPAALTNEPALVDSALYDELTKISAPRVETVEVCTEGGFLGASDKANAGGMTDDEGTWNNGVDVVDKGTVGIFSWELLKAESAQSFTNWLDASGFPYTRSSASVFDHYVRAGWYFIAFRVTASETSPTAGYELCGEFGPIRLGFPSPQALIPARMATANDLASTFYWRVFTVGSRPMQYVSGSGATSGEVTPSLQYAGELTTSELSSYRAVSGIATAGEWLTELNLTFTSNSLSQDIVLASTTEQAAYRRTIYVEKEVDCGVFGCSVSTPPKSSSLLTYALAALGGLGLLTAWRRRSIKTAPDRGRNAAQARSAARSARCVLGSRSGLV